MKTKQIHVGDLRHQTGTTGPHEVLWCPNCDSRASANLGDYFQAGLDEILRCGCGANFRLGYFSTKFIDSKRKGVKS